MLDQILPIKRILWYAQVTTDGNVYWIVDSYNRPLSTKHDSILAAWQNAMEIYTINRL